jgi:hypothetical protein
MRPRRIPRVRAFRTAQPRRGARRWGGGGTSRVGTKSRTRCVATGKVRPGVGRHPADAAASTCGVLRHRPGSRLVRLQRRPAERRCVDRLSRTIPAARHMAICRRVAHDGGGLGRRASRGFELGHSCGHSSAQGHEAGRAPEDLARRVRDNCGPRHCLTRHWPDRLLSRRARLVGSCGSVDGSALHIGLNVRTHRRAQRRIGRSA